MSARRPKDAGLKYNLRSALYRTNSPDISSSSDSNFDDSFEQMVKKKMSSSASQPEGYDSMCEFVTAKGKSDSEGCDTLDEMFKHFKLRENTCDNIPNDWLDKSESSTSSDISSNYATNNAPLATVYEDNESNYRSSKSVDSGLISKDSLDISKNQTHTSKDSLEMFGMTGKSGLSTEPNDTLEDVEYVCDEQDRYLLKPVSKTSRRQSSPSIDNSVISIDSSPDTSYVTAAGNERKLLDVDEIKSEISHGNASDLTLPWSSNGTARSELKLLGEDDIKSEICDSSSASSVVSIVSSSIGSFATATNDLKTLDDVKSEISDTSAIDLRISYPKTISFYSREADISQLNQVTKSSDYQTALNQTSSTISSSDAIVSSARCNTLDDVSSLMNDNSAASSSSQSNIPLTDSSKQFDDSLERIEYMMEQGRKIQAQSTTQTYSDSSPKGSFNYSPVLQSTKTPEPRNYSSQISQQRLISSKSKPMLFCSSYKKKVGSPATQDVTPATRILKPSNRLPIAKSHFEKKYQSPTISPAFKKPTQVTPAWKKEIPRINAATANRNPSTKNKHFDHIVSPISAYIKNIAAPPLLANVKPTSDFFDSSYCNKIPKDLDYSVVSDDGGKSKPVATLPMKFFSSSQQQRVINSKIQKIPGGEKLNRIIGQIPLVISHEGRIHSGSPVKPYDPIDESLANMSMMSGDISVQVVRDVKRH